MMQRDFLFELGCEELPAGSLSKLATQLSRDIEASLHAAKLNLGQVQWFATPRRLAVLVTGLDTEQATQHIERRGPPKAAAFDQDGNPSKAAEGFARSCGVTLDDLEEVETDKGVWLYYRGTEAGKATADLLPEIVQTALDKLLIPKRMRWGAGSAQFLRPVRWAVALFGDEVLAFEVYGQTTSNQSYGHRFHHPEAITIAQPRDYLEQLRLAKVEPDFALRRANIHRQLLATAEQIGGEAIVDDDLLDEVTGLVEHPVVVAGNFDEEFLALPNEVLIITLQEHQRYFTVKGADGKLLNWFITFSNLDSTDLSVVANGNERVVRPRLADAMFFWQNDAKEKLEARIPKLKDVIFQRDLGSMADKAQRVSAIAEHIATLMGADPEQAKRAAELARCDLLTEVVYEIPEVQGTIGRYYAERDGEPAEVAAAIEEQYLPRFAGDSLPQTNTGMALSIAEKMDTIAGIFSIGKKPTGDKDPFALRRAALGVLRILAENNLPIVLEELISLAVEHQPGASLDLGFAESLGVETAGRAKVPYQEAIKLINQFMLERLRAWQLDQGYTAEQFAAIAAVYVGSVSDFIERLEAVAAFTKLSAAETLTSANKRIGNLLKKADRVGGLVDITCFSEPAEKQLYATMNTLRGDVMALVDQQAYVEALTRLAELKDPVDDFFDNVMVMTDDLAVRNNRLALLAELKTLCSQVADIALLQR